MPSPKQACWESIIAEWEASGQSQKAFCEARGLVFPTFAYWRQRIISAAEASSQPVAVACYEVQPAAPLMPDIRSHSIETEGITLVLGSAASVTIRGQLTLGQLESVVRACAQENRRHAEP
jgi:hypothetical protein